MKGNDLECGCKIASTVGKKFIELKNHVESAKTSKLWLLGILNRYATNSISGELFAYWAPYEFALRVDLNSKDTRNCTANRIR